MKAVLDEILKWPVIVQGALGSALFAAILALGTWLIRAVQTYFRGFSRSRRLDRLHNEGLRLQGLVTENPALSALTLVTLLYGAFRELLKAVFVICLGLIFGSFIPVLHVVGFVMALYYLLLALDAVRGSTDDDPKKRLDEVYKEIEKLEAET